MKCRMKVVQLNEIYMCTEFHMNMCKYVWAIHKDFRLCSRGRRRATVTRPGPSLCGVRTPTDSNVCANFQEFLSMLRPPKVPGWLNKKKKKKKKKIIIILWKSIGPCALLAWALNIAASSDGGPKRQCKRHPGGNKQPCPAGTCTTVTLWQSGFKGYGN